MRALVSTIEPIDGGVPTMTRWICRMLEEVNITPILAWYAPWRNYPLLSVPFYNTLSGKRPGTTLTTAFNNYHSYGIGSWLPELEFTHYLPSNSWKKLVTSCHLHLVVSGNILPASPYIYLGIPCLAWVATPWEADRKDRVAKFTLPRKILDTMINTPILRKLEKHILCSNRSQVVCLSKYTARELSKLGNENIKDVMYMPINSDLFYPDYSKTVPWRIGFSGRYCDPRKNIRLLLESINILKNQGYGVELVLVGEKSDEALAPMINEFALEGHLTRYLHLSSQDLSPILQSFDVFAIPSHQEGLCIAALEAMACGVPVVSTRCGGPEDYVQPGITGELADRTAESFALMLKSICLHRKRRQQLSCAAVKWIECNASEAASRREFLRHLNQLGTKSGYFIRT